MAIIDDNPELVKTDKCELTDMPMEQRDESPHELTGIGMPPTSALLSTSGLAPHRSSSVLRSGVDPCHTAALIPGSHPVNGFHRANFKLSQNWFPEF